MEYAEAFDMLKEADSISFQGVSGVRYQIVEKILYADVPYIVVCPVGFDVKYQPGLYDITIDEILADDKVKLYTSVLINTKRS